MKYLILTLLAFQVHGKSPVLIDESFLQKALEHRPPTIEQIEVTLLGKKLELATAKDKLNTSLNAGTSYFKTEERAFAAFIPVTTPVKTTEVGVEKTTEFGLKVGLRGFAEQITNNFVQNGTTTGVSLNAGIDIWKEVFKKQTKSRLSNMQNNFEVEKIKAQIAKQAFLNNIRKVYWSLVANQESLKVSQALIKSSVKQVKEAKKRLANNVADKGEVARYESQLASRKASIISLQYQRELLIRNLKELLPHLALEEIALAPYSINQAVQTVLACTAVIGSQGEMPKNFTLYDEVVELIKKQTASEKLLNSSYDDPEVVVTSEIGYKGRDFSYSKSLNDLSDNKYQNYALGIQVNIPLDKRKKTTEDILKEVTNKRSRALINNEIGRMNAFHTQTVRQITYLQQIIRSQQNNTKFLQQSLKSSKKKYNQARLTVQQYVNEQDAFLQSNIDEINTKLTAIHTILDYLSVYTLTPCQLNRYKI